MSKDTKTFTNAGTSTHRGENTFRFANGPAKARAAILKRGNHIDINLIELPSPMTKVQAIEFLKTKGITANLPKTGRGSGATPDQLQKHAALVVEREKATAALLEAAKKDDAAAIDKL